MAKKIFLTAFIFVSLVIIMAPFSVFSAGDTAQTGETCYPDVTTADDTLGGTGAETDCPYVPAMGSTFLNINWDLTDSRTKINDPYCVVTCSRPGVSCTGGNAKDANGSLKFSVTGPWLTIKDSAKISKPGNIDNKYQIYCCEKKKAGESGIFCRTGSPSVSSKKIKLNSRYGWGGCGAPPSESIIRSCPRTGEKILSGFRYVVKYVNSPLSCTVRVLLPGSAEKKLEEIAIKKGSQYNLFYLMDLGFSFVNPGSTFTQVKATLNIVDDAVTCVETVVQ
jgi:hypothetical protein